MNIAVLSDIHGNYVALVKCIEYALARDIDTFVFLGDYIGELAYPQKTMEILYGLNAQCKCYFIRGNKEDYWINYKRGNWNGWKKYDSTTGCLAYAYANLTEKDIRFFESLSHVGEVNIEGMPGITICHGSPENAREEMKAEKERTYALMEKDKNNLILCGHTHRREKIEHNGTTVLNAGSVGISLDGEAKAQFLILRGDGNGWNPEFVSVDYDREKVISELYISGLTAQAPYWCKITEAVLRKGTVSHGSVLSKAMELCRKERGVCNWPEIPERYWELAVAEML